MESGFIGEIAIGAMGHRRWPNEAKGRFVAETTFPGITVDEVAAQHDMKANHLSEWSGRAQKGKLMATDLAGAEFSGVVRTEPPLEAETDDRIEIVTGQVTAKAPQNLRARAAVRATPDSQGLMRLESHDRPTRMAMSKPSSITLATRSEKLTSHSNSKVPINRKLAR